MYNCYGWIQLGMNRRHIDLNDPNEEKFQEEIDDLDTELELKVKARLKELGESGWFISQYMNTNNLSDLVSIQYSRNHFCELARDFYKWIAEISDGSHGVLYEMDDERKGLDSDKPYRILRLVGKEVDEFDETLINEKFSVVNY